VHLTCFLKGNRKGLLVPTTCTDTELLHLRNSLPDSVVVQRIEERLSALGNCIISNDHVALVHSDIDRETEDIVRMTPSIYNQLIVSYRLPMFWELKFSGRRLLEILWLVVIAKLQIKADWFIQEPVWRI